MGQRTCSACGVVVGPYVKQCPPCRFWGKVEKTETCWLWTGYLHHGYGIFMLKKREAEFYAAHRFAYQTLVGPIPQGLQLDHLCRNRACVNPAHLEAVTQRENILRGDAPPALRARQTHCLRGHPLAGDNLVLEGNRGVRRCRACRNANANRRYHERRALGFGWRDARRSQRWRDALEAVGR